MRQSSFIVLLLPFPVLALLFELRLEVYRHACCRDPSIRVKPT